MIKIRDHLVRRARGCDENARALRQDSWWCHRRAPRRARPPTVENGTLPHRPAKKERADTATVSILVERRQSLQRDPAVRKQARREAHRIFAPLLSGVLAFGLLFSTTLAAEAVKVAPIKIAVFDFELEDLSPAASHLDKTTSAAATMEKVSREARRELAQSGRYEVIDPGTVDAKPATQKALRNCDGCEAGIALRLGADESLIGVVRKATQTDYYVVIQIRDARTGKLINQQEANFAGSEEGWPTGARMLIKHQILVSEQP